MEVGNRYCYALQKDYVRRDMWGTTNFFWSTYGVRRTLWFLIVDTIAECRKKE